MSNLFRALKTDEKKVAEGVWFENIVGDAAFKIAKSTSPPYKEYFLKITKPYRRQLRNENLPEDKSNELLCDAYSKHILLDWRNVIDENGKEVEYSPAVGYKYLLELEEFRTIVQELSGDVESFRKEWVEESEEVLKKSGRVETSMG